MKGILSIRASKDSPWYTVPMVQRTVSTVFSLSSVIINGGASSTTSTTLSVDFTFTNGAPTHYRIGETSDLSSVAWVAYSSKPISYTISGYGTKTIYMQLKNAEIETYVKSSSINYIDSSVINITNFTIAGGVSPYSNLTVPISLSTNGAPTHYRIGETSDLSSVAWVAYSSSISYTFSSYGTKTLYAQVKNATSTSPTASSSIVLQEESSGEIKMYLGFNNPTTGAILKNTLSGVTYNQINGNLNILNNSAPLYDSNGNELTSWLFNFNKNTYYVANEVFPNQSGANITLLSAEIAQSDTGNIPISAYSQALLSSSMSYKMRLSMTLPIGSYTIRFLWSGKSYVSMSETERQATHYAVCQGNSILSQTDGGVGTGTGWTALNNVAFHNPLNFVVSNASVPIDIAAWSTIQGGRPGINLIEITKTN